MKGVHHVTYSLSQAVCPVVLWSMTQNYWPQRLNELHLNELYAASRLCQRHSSQGLIAIRRPGLQPCLWQRWFDPRCRQIFPQSASGKWVYRYRTMIFGWLWGLLSERNSGISGCQEIKNYQPKGPHIIRFPRDGWRGGKMGNLSLK